MTKEEQAEKRCSKYFQENCYKENRWADTHDLVTMYLDGYNKANEWHDLIADPNDLPKEEHKSPSECKNFYVVWFGKNNFSGAKFINGKFCDGDFVYYPDEIVKWKEIILPELSKESE